MTFVHRFDLLSAAQTAHRDVAVGSIADTKGADVGGEQVDLWGFFAGVLGIPERRSRSGELIGDRQR